MKPFIIVLSFFLSISCKNNDDGKNFTNSSILAFNLIKTSVDETINIQPSINTSNYVVDLSKGLSLNIVGRDSFIFVKEKYLPVTHEDSVTYYDTNGKPRVSRSMIITFDTIKQVDEKTVRVITRKIKSADSIVTANLVLKRKANGYVCVRCEESKP